MMNPIHTSIVLLAIFLVTSGVQAQVELSAAFPNLSFVRPVDLQHVDDGTGRLFVVEQAGVIYAIDRSGPEPTASVFLDIQDTAHLGDNEEGLLGLAFHPDFASNGYFYVYYTARNPRRSAVARYHARPDDPDAADPNSEVLVLEIRQPFTNHNGGQITFGPDGYLYIATGDGGSQKDPAGHGQSLESLLGKILRIDVDHPSGGRDYGIPPDNPFVGRGRDVREEIYAYGLRNPWRFSFDPVNGTIWSGDVGQDAREEVNIIRRGGNYGWNIMEGKLCFNPPEGCDMTGLEKPVWDHQHTNGGRSITGGFVYRGSRVPELLGAYVYADFATGQIWALWYDGQNPPVNTEILDTDLHISSFGVDALNELYLCAFDGAIYWFEGSTTAVSEDVENLPLHCALHQNHPNPFNQSTSIRFNVPRRSAVELEVFDLLGQRVGLLQEGTLPAGYHQRLWQPRDLASAVYIYRLRADGFVRTRTLVLLK